MGIDPRVFDQLKNHRSELDIGKQLPEFAKFTGRLDYRFAGSELARQSSNWRAGLAKTKSKVPNSTWPA